jgi:hypothetical protein
MNDINTLIITYSASAVRSTHLANHAVCPPGREKREKKRKKRNEKRKKKQVERSVSRNVTV